VLVIGHAVRSVEVKVFSPGIGTEEIPDFVRFFVTLFGGEEAGDAGEVEVGLGGDLAGQQHHARCDHGLAGDAAHRIVTQGLVEHRVGDLIGHLVRVPHADAFRGEKPLRHRSRPISL